MELRQNPPVFAYDNDTITVERGSMHKEFHIFASHFDTRFTMTGIPGTPPLVFSSLFEATRHARTAADSDDGFVMIYGEGGQAVNRIPFCVRS